VDEAEYQNDVFTVLEGFPLDGRCAYILYIYHYMMIVLATLASSG
jgi:hypothetical protein